MKSFYYYALYPGMCSIWLIYFWVAPSSENAPSLPYCKTHKGKLSNTSLGYLFQTLTALVRSIFQGASLHFPMLNLVIGMSAIYMCSPWLLHRSATINQPSIADFNAATVTYNSWVSGLWMQFPELHVKYSPRLGHLNKMKRLWKVRTCLPVQYCLS